MTVGATSMNEQSVGYSSQGPAALDPDNKPDFCSITNFTGFSTSDDGTSAATPIAAGVVALMKKAKPSLTQDEAKGPESHRKRHRPGWLRSALGLPGSSARRLPTMSSRFLPSSTDGNPRADSARVVAAFRRPRPLQPARQPLHQHKSREVILRHFT